MAFFALVYCDGWWGETAVVGGWTGWWHAGIAGLDVVLRCETGWRAGWYAGVYWR